MNTQHKTERFSPRIPTIRRVLPPGGPPAPSLSSGGARAIAPRLWPAAGLALLLMVALVTTAVAWADRPLLPTEVPNIFDPEVRAHFQPAGLANLWDNPDFPVVILLNTAGEQPQVMLLGLDARNGKETWSLTSDPIILIVLLVEPTTIQGLYVDAGFADQGKPSGTYVAVDNPNSQPLPDLLKALTPVPTQISM